MKRQRLQLCVLLGVGVLGAITPACARDEQAHASARGPIPLRDMRPYNLLFLQFVPEVPDVLPLRASRYSLQLDLANNLLIPAADRGATVVEDNEYQRLTFSWHRGLGRQTELAVFIPLLWRNGGFLDGIISAYHRLVGIPANAGDDPLGRDYWPQYRSILEIIDASGNVVVNKGNAFGSGETSVTLKRSLLRPSPRSALAVRFGLKLPTGNPTLLLGSGNVDGGLSLDGRYNVGRDLTVYLQFAGIVMGHVSRVPGAQSSMWQALYGFEYHPNRRDAFIVQVDGNSLALRTGNHFADSGDVTATFGYRRLLDSRHSLFLSYTENGDIHNYTLRGLSNIGPDITFSAGIEWH